MVGVNIISLLISIVVFVILYIIFQWLVGLAAAEFGANMPGGVIKALAALLALIFSGVFYVQGPRLWTRP